MPVARPLSALIALTLAATAAPAAQPAPPVAGGELKRVHVLIAAEKSDPDLAPMVDLDVATFRRVLDAHLPADRQQVATLTGRGLTAEAVLAHYQKLDVRPTDALVFYYTGHGSFRDGNGQSRHTLEFGYDPRSGQLSRHAMRRQELKAAMLAKKAGLTVILTDCCSDHVRVPPPPDHKPRAKPRAVGPGPAAPTPLGRALFLQARGVVDMTAATNGQVALGDVMVGSYFTVGLERAAADAVPPADWRGFAKRVTDKTAEVYKQELRRPELQELAKSLRGKRVQVPEAFDLPGPAAAGAGGYAVVALDNPGEAAVRLQVRWADTDSWRPVVVGPRKTLPAFTAHPGGRPASLQVMLDGKATALPARVSAQRPSRDNLAAVAAVYELPSLKPAGKAAKARGLGEVELEEEPPPAR